MVTYRGLDIEGIYRKMGISGRSDLRVGMDLMAPAFKSTSPQRGKAWHGEKWEIRVSKGLAGAWAAPTSSHPSEEEFILGRDVDTFRIVEIHSDRIVVQALRSEDLAKKRKQN
jgi:hypothetical protein